jgi:predicted Zn-dependent protease
VFRLYRARRRSGERRLADLEAARRIGDGWRVGVALAEYHLAADDLEVAEAVLADYIKRFPRRNPLEILYAETLQRLGKNRECVEFLKGVKILPSEFGRNAVKFWQEAWKALGDEKMAQTYPENLGAGKPFPDEDD